MKKKIVLIAFASVLLLATVFFLYPRNLKSIFLPREAENVDIRLYEFFAEFGEFELSAEETEALLNAMAQTKVRRKLFRQKVFSSLSVYSITVRETDGEPSWVSAEYYPHEQILSITNEKRQYEFYNDDFIEALEAFFQNQ